MLPAPPAGSTDVGYRAGMSGGDGVRRPPEDAAACARMFEEFASTTAARAPLYSRLSAGIAADGELAAVLLTAPVTQRQPVLLFACVHALLLESPDDDLASYYPNLTVDPGGGDPLPAFRAFCQRRREEVEELLRTRSTQTNEIGRCALLLPALSIVSDETGPLAHLDVGASAGLNLLLDRYRYVYDPGGSVGSESPVTLTCGTRGAVPVPARMPAVAARRGIDRAPVDVHDDDQARWLEACVWPDQIDRFERLQAALELARASDLDLRAGDAVVDLAANVDELASAGHVVVTNTWVLNYLTPAQRQDFVAALDDVAARHDVSWIYAESPQLTPELPGPAAGPEVERTALVLVTWRGGRREVAHLADCHPHGYWLHWR